MSIIDHLTDEDIHSLRVFVARGCSVFAALEQRAMLQVPDYPKHKEDAREFHELTESGNKLLQKLGVKNGN